jgi:flagellar P-ring protein precursor FlgI
MAFRIAASLLITQVFFGGAALAQSMRIKDIASIEGVRANQLTGYGLVVGLEGSGDSQQTKFTTQSIANMLESYGINVPADKMKVKNVAAVIVTATLPAFARPGTTIDVIVSSVGDARSLQGGTLLQTPLRAANGDVYAVAQGPVSIGGFTAGGGGSSVSKNHPTVGRIPSGALVEKAPQTDLAPLDTLRITLNVSDFTTASRMAAAIDKKLGGHFARAIDAGAVSVSVPPDYSGSIVRLIAEIESVEITTDSVAKVIVNERTGTVIIGGQARILPVAVAHGALTVEITTDPLVSQPKPLSTGGTTVVTPKTSVSVSEQQASLVEIKGGSTIQELVTALNTLKVTPRDLIAILQAIKQAGALQAQLEVI